jgi:hypothetical protein
MSKRTILGCDVTGQETEDVATYSFTWDGTRYEIDLCDKAREPILSIVKIARPVLRRDKVSAAAKSATEQRTVVRNWARDNGLTVHSNGRVPKEVLEKYNEMHGTSYAR